VAVVLAAGCSADVTRFGFLDDTPRHPPGKVTYAPLVSGYQTGSPGAGKGVKETPLPPIDKASKTPDAPSPPGHVKATDMGLKSAHGPSPWSWANRPPPKEKGRPLWTDEEPFPWPDAQPKAKAPQARSSFQGHYTTRRGDTLAAIAERYKVSLAELKRVNGIADKTAVKTGTVLAIPARATGAAPPPSAPPRVVQVKPLTAPPPEPKVASLKPPAPVPAPRAPVKPGGPKSPPEAAAETTVETTGVTFRWPVAGKVISTFGPQPDGSKNEGIKLSVPIGTDIHAAAAGRVHYAGDGLKGYGNLILIRHSDGWVSTYAHADRMLVKVGDRVKRGQVIGKTGRTGPVAQPQLGFELRKSSVPVDPLEHLAK
jgi:murein DD-endopeptidase MepM/ murein hydrolase activator NlpD